MASAESRFWLSSVSGRSYGKQHTPPNEAGRQSLLAAAAKEHTDATGLLVCEKAEASLIAAMYQSRNPPAFLSTGMRTEASL